MKRKLLISLFVFSVAFFGFSSRESFASTHYVDGSSLRISPVNGTYMGGSVSNSSTVTISFDFYIEDDDYISSNILRLYVSGGYKDITGYNDLVEADGAVDNKYTFTRTININDYYNDYEGIVGPDLFVYVDGASGSEVIEPDESSSFFIDKTAPTSSSVTQAYSVYGTDEVTVKWIGEDGETNVKGADLYYRKDGGSWNLAGLDSGEGTYPFTPIVLTKAELGGSGVYDFYVVAYDYSGNKQAKSPVVEKSVELLDSQDSEPVTEPEEEETEDEVVYDEHGCIPADAERWCEAWQRCYKDWEEDCPVSENTSAPTTETDGEDTFGTYEMSVDDVVEIKGDQDDYKLDFEMLENLSNIMNFTIQDSSGLGSIRFTETLDFTDETTINNINDIGSFVFISRGIIELNVDGNAKLGGKPAKLTMNDLAFSTTPKILVDGEEDLENIVSNIQYDSETGVLTFDVEHFTRFEAVASENEPNEEWDAIANSDYVSVDVWTVETVYLVLGGSLFVSSLLAIAIFYGGKKLYKNVKIRKVNKDKNVNKVVKKEDSKVEGK